MGGKQQVETTQTRIINAARQLFGQRGFHGTTTAEIARAAGVAEGTIYRYFTDKKDLLVACVLPVIEEAVRREKAIVTGPSPRAILTARIKERVSVIREHLEIFDVLFTEGKHHPEIAAILLAQVSSQISQSEWEQLLAALGAENLPRPINPLIMNVGITAAIWAMLQVGPASDMLFASWPTPARYADMEADVAEFVCNAVLGPEPRKGGNADA